LAKLSVDQALLKAKSYAKKGEIEEAKKLYQAVLQAFPKNKQAQQELVALNKHKQPAATQGPPQDTINQLFNLYNRGQLTAVVEQAQALTEQYPEAFIIWNILGAANKGLGKVQAASEAFRKVTELNPTLDDGFNNLGIALKDQGKLDDAIVSYKKALSLKPDYAEAYYNMGIALTDQGKLMLYVWLELAILHVE
jgi:tetratricopeptide (TPR) repeat protein